MPLPIDDLDVVLSRTADLWAGLRKKNVFLTGGTGFIGKWLVESFLHINERLQLQASIHLLSRSPEQFLADYPWLVDRKDFYLVPGDVRSFTYPPGEFSHIVHGAASVAAPDAPLETFDAILAGTNHVLGFAKQCHASRFLFLSSGAVYGKQPPSVERIPESFAGAPATNLAQSAYGEAKRAAEWIAFETGKTQNIDVCSARCFAFVGPYLPLDKHFAIGNFIRDSMQGTPIRIMGDGMPSRSYLYASDLSIWLWTILLKGKKNESYNVGSDESLTILELARLVAKISNRPTDVLVANNSLSSTGVERYVPDIEKAKTELGLSILTPLASAITKTMDWIEKLK